MHPANSNARYRFIARIRCEPLTFRLAVSISHMDIEASVVKIL